MGQTFRGRTCTLNVSKTLIMNAKLKFDQFSLVIPTTKILFFFLHEYNDLTNQQMNKMSNDETEKEKNPFPIHFQSRSLEYSP